MVTSLIKSRNFIKPPVLKVFERRSRVDLETVHTSRKFLATPLPGDSPMIVILIGMYLPSHSSNFVVIRHGLDKLHSVKGLAKAGKQREQFKSIV